MRRADLLIGPVEMLPWDPLARLRAWRASRAAGPARSQCLGPAGGCAV